jgi:transcriptional regulator with XRE-family HTH domain
MLTLSQRMKVLVETKLPKYGRFQELERLTGIKNATWQKWARDKQRPTVEMIEGVARVWPAHAYWLATGDELPKEGMTSPRELETTAERNLVDATDQVLKYRVRVRNELMASQAVSLLDTEHQTDESLREIAEKFVSTLMAGESVESRTLDESLEAAYRVALTHDQFLRDIERVREQLIVQTMQRSINGHQ